MERSFIRCRLCCDDYEVMLMQADRRGYQEHQCGEREAQMPKEKNLRHMLLQFETGVFNRQTHIAI
jgi:hypothetical protein